MQWIDCNERLPPQDVYVLVLKFSICNKTGWEYEGIEIANRFGKDWYEGKDGQEITSNGKYGTVTHWMPLPDVPSKQKLVIHEDKPLALESKVNALEQQIEIIVDTIKEKL